MPKKKDEEEKIVAQAQADPINVPLPVPFPPFPWFPVSGLYEWRRRFPIVTRPLPNIPINPVPTRTPGGMEGPEELEGMETTAQASESEARIPWWFRREELRLDVDGRYPQMTASGTIYHFLSSRTHWIAGLTKTAANTWSGTIWYKDGTVTNFPYTQVQIQINNSVFPGQRSAQVVFSGGGSSTLTRNFKFKSPYFHTVEFEFDSVTGVTPTTSINTCDHPNRPATLPCENLSIETAFPPHRLSGNAHGRFRGSDFGRRTQRAVE